MNQFKVSKLECFAIRRRDWLFNIMMLDRQMCEGWGLMEKVNEIVETHRKKQDAKWFWCDRQYLDSEEVRRELLDSSEFCTKVQQIKSKIWKEMTSKYSLIEESGGGMYKNYTIIIQDNETKKFYQGECDNYGGINTANYSITFTEVIPTTEPKIRYEIPNQG